MSFYERMQPSTNIIEEAQKTFNTAYSKPLANLATKVASRLPNKLGANKLNAYALNVQNNRSQLAKNIRASRARGGVGRVNATIKSQMADPKANIKNNGLYQELAKTRSATSINKQVQANPSLFKTGSRPGFVERMTNKSIRGGRAIGAEVKNAIKATPEIYNRLTTPPGLAVQPTRAAPQAAQRAQEVINAPLNSTYNLGVVPGSTKRPI